MENLIKLWERHSVKYKKLADKTESAIKEEGLLASAEVYAVCADELKRAVASQSINAASHEVECWYCHKKWGKGHKCGICGREGR